MHQDLFAGKINPQASILFPKCPTCEPGGHIFPKSPWPLPLVEFEVVTQQFACYVACRLA